MRFIIRGTGFSTLTPYISRYFDTTTGSKTDSHSYQKLQRFCSGCHLRWFLFSCVIAPLEQGGNRIHIKMSMTAPGCGMGNVLKADVESRLSRLPSVKEVHVEVVFDPPWHPGLMSDAAKLQLGFDLDYGATPASPAIHEGR